MSTILWQQGNGMLAFTVMADADGDPDAHAQELIARGDIPADWKLLGTRLPWPNTGHPHEVHRWDGSSIVVDLEAAREWTKGRLRAERAPKLAELDVQVMRALEAGHSTIEIGLEKQRLRDITKLADQAQTWDELQALKP